MRTTIKNVWDKDKKYGEYFYKMATGQLPAMFCAVALANTIKKIYKNDMKVLDVGCGAGHYLRSFRENINKNIDYTGIDFSPSFIRLAKKAFRDSAEFAVGEIQNIPFKNNQFDIVTASNIILHLPPPPLKAFKELLRVSKKYVVARTVFGERNYIMQEVLSNSDFGINQPDIALFKSDGIPMSFNYFNLYTESYFRDLINKIAPKAKVNIIKDLSYKQFDNRKTTRSTGTRVVNRLQISGNLLLDWRFIIIEK
ncbi:MAG: class I SAM-dependent methyltransferase [Patescibacteria group bacterium]